ncbi:uncharacterized protein N7443_003135 [Penicillium atrosanguineum]|uniref:uncharacterized protein n=1 Tax=Penicillium atrosanguineum TaxID=1132637 RepID=UPI002393E0F5|nr:uncharacterized protein N7443_003135 [Penicillium atrosanguineum]KAJ5117228.1 hypothetical protein N7526_011337 [Penicillium atrosanguineum]KAJ5310674.1 hypothetical protein N7443_003135 [Penicillium atrosanguineum]
MRWMRGTIHVNVCLYHIEPILKRPVKSKAKQKSKLNLSFGSGETSMTDDGEQESEVIIPKRHGLGRQAMERNAVQRNLTPSNASETLSARVGHDQGRPSYSNDYLKELRDSTPSTPKASTDDEKDRAIDIAAKFGEVMTVSSSSAIPSEAEIREKKARRARLALEHGAKEEDFISLDNHMADQDDDWDAVVRSEKEQLSDTRLVRDDEDFAEGFDEYVEDGKISLGRKAERDQKRKDRDAMRELINDAEGVSDDEDSDLEEKAAYEAAQTRAAMGHGKPSGLARPGTPPKVTSLPKLSNSLERLRLSLASMETAKTQMISRMEELRKEKADIAVREVEIQGMIKEAGDNYERLKMEAGVDPSSDANASAGALEQSRGLESIGAPIANSDSSSGETEV